MSGSRQLGPACLNVAGSTRWSVQPADEKFLWKTTSTQTVASCLCWCVEPYFFSHLLLDWQKDEYLCSFLEAVPRWVICHMLQPVFQFLLRVVVVVVGPFLLLPPQKTSKSLASEPDSEAVSATRISLMTSSSSFIFFQANATDTYNGLPYLHSSAWLAQFRNVMPLRYECLLQWQQNRSNAMMWQLYEFQEFGGAKGFKYTDGCVLHVTTPQPPQITPAPPVAVNIDFCGYLWFLSIWFIWIIWVQYTTDNFSGQERVFVS